MAAPRTGLNPATHSVGFSAKLVTVRAVSADGTTAVCVDRQNTQTAVSMLVQRGKGPLPQAGETWLLTQDLGMWTFAAIVAGSSAQLAGSLAVRQRITASSSAPASPAGGDIWINESDGNAISVWSGSAWTALALGTGALAPGAVTGSEIAPGTITSAQLAPDAGITAGQVAFAATDIGGTRIWTIAAEPVDPAIGDLWINGFEGNLLSVWSGGAWVPVPFGAGAFAPGVLPVSLSSPGVFPSGNTVTPAVITPLFPTEGTGEGTPYPVYSLKTWFRGTWGARDMTLYADISGTLTAVAVVDELFVPGAAAGHGIEGWIELEVAVSGPAACRLHISGAIHDTSADPNNSASSACPVSGSVMTGAAFEPGNTIALAAAFSGAVTGQTLIAEGSRFWRTG